MVKGLQFGFSFNVRYLQTLIAIIWIILHWRSASWALWSFQIQSNAEEIPEGNQNHRSLNEAMLEWLFQISLSELIFSIYFSLYYRFVLHTYSKIWIVILWLIWFDKKTEFSKTRKLFQHAERMRIVLNIFPNIYDQFWLSLQIFCRASKYFFRADLCKITTSSK